ncbi:MAG: peptide deformylase [Caulobacteraceae bacterium]|nr:peptide deformylase [Caulobacteraceae bacterium]NDG32840.1 peptide deformylase [bacterium]
MIQNLISSNDPLLKTKIELFDFSKFTSEQVQKICNDLIETMIHFEGLGLSANQIGLPHRVFVMWSNPTVVCFNPKIVSYEGDPIFFSEGCLSYPNLYVKIKRPPAIRVRYQKPNGETVTDRLMGMSARVFQHELDHLDGVIYTTRANKIHMDRAFRNKKAHDRIVKRANNANS